MHVLLRENGNKLNTLSVSSLPIASKPSYKFRTLLQSPHPKNIFLKSKADGKSAMLVAQILWWGLGLTLAYDICESLLHWPHWMAMVLYSALMIASTWFGLRSMILIACLTLPSLLGVIYFSIFEAMTGTSLLALWSQLLTSKLLEYLGWFLMVLGSFVNGAGYYSHPRKITMISFACYMCLAIGGIMMIASAVQLAQNSAPAKQLFIAVQQASYFLWVFGLTSAKMTKPQERAQQKQRIKLPSKYFLLIIGTIGIVIYDWLFLSISGWAQCGFMLLPPFALLLLSKYVCFD